VRVQWWRVLGGNGIHCSLFLRFGYPGPNPSRAAEDYLSILLHGLPPACGSLGHQDIVPSNDRLIECLMQERRMYIELHYLLASYFLFVLIKIKTSVVSVQDRAISCF
jgi:hypothetical protein